MKRWMYIFAGFCWCLFGLGFGIFLIQYLAEGAGGEFLGFLTLPQSFVMGWVHVVGLAVVSLLCFSVGLILLLRGAVPRPE